MNTVMDIIGFEQRVRERAYFLWENEGRGHGRDVEHWLICEEATRAELTAPAREEAAHVEAAAEPALIEAPIPPKAKSAPAPIKAAAKPKAAPRKKKIAAK